MSVYRVAATPEMLMAALHERPSVLAVSESVLPRAIKLVGALATEARRSGYRVGLNSRLKTPKLFLQTGKVRRAVRVLEEQEQVKHKLTDEDRRVLRSKSYWTPPPQFDSVPSGRINIQISGTAWGTERTWSDAPGHRLEKQVRQIIEGVTALLKAEEAERARAEQEVLERHARRLREDAEKQRAWEVAMDRASVRAYESLRRTFFRAACDAWIAADEIRGFCDALEITIEDRTASGTTSCGGSVGRVPQLTRSTR